MTIQGALGICAWSSGMQKKDWKKKGMSSGGGGWRIEVAEGSMGGGKSGGEEKAKEHEGLERLKLKGVFISGVVLR